MKLHLFLLFTFSIMLAFDSASATDNHSAACEEFVAQKVTTENALPGAVVRVNEVIRNGVTSGDRGRLDYLRAYVEPGGVFEGGFGAPPGVELEILSPPKKSHSINTIKVKDVVSGKVGYVFWTEFKGSTTLIKPSTQPPPPAKVKREKIQFPHKPQRDQFEALAAIGQNWFGRSFAKVGDKVWVSNSTRKMSKNNVGVLLEIQIPLVPGNWANRGFASVQSIAGHLFQTGHYDVVPLTDEEYELVAASPD